jgi:hypothetical protein
MPDNQHWIGTWTTAPAPAEGAAFSNQTLRMTARTSLGGSTARVRLSNAYGSRKLTIGAARIALRDAGPGILSASDRKLTFGGSESATIATGALLVSDPVALDLPPLADVAVSIYLPEELSPSFGITGRHARQTNYVSPPGNFTASVVMPVGQITGDWFFVSGIDVLTSAETAGSWRSGIR